MVHRASVLLWLSLLPPRTLVSISYRFVGAREQPWKAGSTTERHSLRSIILACANIYRAARALPKLARQFLLCSPALRANKQHAAVLETKPCQPARLATRWSSCIAYPLLRDALWMVRQNDEGRCIYPPQLELISYLSIEQGT